MATLAAANTAAPTETHPTDPLTGVPLPQASAALDIPSTDPWLFGYHPTCWGYFPDADRVLPQLTKIVTARGVNGTIDPTNPMPTKNRYEAEGWTILDPRVVGTFVKRHVVRRGAAYLEAWVTPIPGTRVVECEPGANEAFLTHLVDKGHVAPLPEHIRRRGLAEAQRELSRLERIDGPMTTQRQALITRTQAAIAAWERGSAPAPKPAAAAKK